ncbi:hypothetical protein ACF08W_15640 [Streptomyces sp. NPDC015144]|uniref:hypothetical protein n=1 Tax=Streptomyces sp. NPDC015144 TaxID=3364944 RepID=UPI0036F7EDA4
MEQHVTAERPGAEPSMARLLPWTGEGGKPCYLLAGGDGGGLMSRMADDMESVQLGMAGDLLGHADDLLADERSTAPQIRFLAARLSESLRQVVRVAESRGLRLAGVVPGDGEP